MSGVLYYRPVRSSWAGLTGNEMIKSGLRGRIRQAWNWAKDIGGSTDYHGRPKSVVPPGSDMAINPLRAAVRTGYETVKNNPGKALGIAGGGAGLAGGGLGYLNYQAGQQQATMAAAREAANEAIKNKPKADPDLLEQGGGTVRDFVTSNWPLLAGAGVGLGGLGLWMKNRADREREEEEQALLGGMHSKVGMVQLATEFPVQVGFLARCAERKLTGSQVREAIEKCASISDGMAEDWTNFFGVAAELTAGASSGMVKAAQDPLKPVVDPVADPKTPPTQTSGGGFNATAQTAQAVHPQPAITLPMQTARQVRGTPVESPLASYSQYRQPFATPPASRAAMPSLPGYNPPTAGATPPPPPAAAPASQAYVAPPPPEPSATPAASAQPTTPQPYMNNEQAAAARGRSAADLLKMKRWQKEYLAADRIAGDPNMPSEQRAMAMEQARQLIANKPGFTSAGPAGKDYVDTAARLEMKNLRESAAHDADPWNQFYGATTNRFTEGQAAEQAALKAGIPAPMAKLRNTMDPSNDRGLMKALGRGALEIPGALGSLVATPLSAAWDTSQGANKAFWGQGSWDPRTWDYRNTAGSAIEFADPVTQAIGVDPFRAAGNEGLFNRTHAGGTGQVAGTTSGAPGSAAYLASPERQKELAGSKGSLMATQADKLYDKYRETGDESYLWMAQAPEHAEAIAATLASLGMTVPGGPVGAGGAAGAGAGAEGAAAATGAGLAEGAAATAPHWARGLGWAAPGTNLSKVLPGRVSQAINFLTRNRSVLNTPGVSQVGNLAKNAPGVSQVGNMIKSVPKPQWLTGGAAGTTSLGRSISGMMDKAPELAAAAPNKAREAMKNLGLSPTEGGLMVAQAHQGHISGQAMAEENQRLGGETAAGVRPIDPKLMPANSSFAQKQVWAEQAVESQMVSIAKQRELAGLPKMTVQEAEQKRTELGMGLSKQIVGQAQNDVAASDIGMAAGGKYDPNGNIDLNHPEFDAKNTYKFLDGGPTKGARMKGVVTQYQLDKQSFDDMENKMDTAMTPDMKQRLLSGEPVTDQDKAALATAGIDVPTATKQLARMATAKMLISSATEHNGDMTALQAKAQSPEGPLQAARADPTLDAKAKEKAAAEGTDWWTALTQIWSDLGPTGQVFAVGGLALGAIGLLNSFMGEGGMGSMLMTLLGGAGLGLAANKANLLPESVSSFLNPILGQFGLSGLSSGGASDLGEAPPDAGAPTPTAPGATLPPGAPAAMPAPAADQALPPDVFANTPGTPSPTAPVAPIAPAATVPAAPAAPAQPRAAMEPPAAAAPAAPAATATPQIVDAQSAMAAASKLGINMVKDPAAVEQLMKLPIQDQAALVNTMVEQDAQTRAKLPWNERMNPLNPSLDTKLGIAAGLFKGDPEGVTQRVRDALDAPNLTPRNVYQVLKAHGLAKKMRQR